MFKSLLIPGLLYNSKSAGLLQGKTLSNYSYMMNFSANINDAESYTFIDNYCGDEDEMNTFNSLVIHQNGQSNFGQFSLDSFLFETDNDQGELYLHCDIMLCNPTTENCAVCFDQTSRRRRSVTLSDAESNHSQLGNVGSLGPFVIG